MVSVGIDAKAANFPVGVVENGEMCHPLSWPLAAHTIIKARDCTRFFGPEQFGPNSRVVRRRIVRPKCSKGVIVLEQNISYRPGSTWRKSTLVPAAPAAPQQLPSQLLSHAAVPLRRPSDELVCGRRAPSLSRSATTWIQGVRSRPAEDFLMGSLSTIPALERGRYMTSHCGARCMLVLSLSARPFTHPVAASCTAGTNHPRSRA